MVRRLALVACVTLIPSSSLYLPISLFALIQASALVQHVSAPYESPWLNRGELASLYLLLMNYITALVLHETIAGAGAGGAGPNAKDASGASDEVQLNVWTVALLSANLAFIVILAGLLFRTLQQAYRVFSARLLKQWPHGIVAWCCSNNRSSSSGKHSRHSRHKVRATAAAAAAATAATTAVLSSKKTSRAASTLPLQPQQEPSSAAAPFMEDRSAPITVALAAATFAASAAVSTPSASSSPPTVVRDSEAPHHTQMHVLPHSGELRLPLLDDIDQAQL